jgi:3-phenylpropionate/trans-cinnamate dioxygenase ferredoxin subunit
MGEWVQVAQGGDVPEGRAKIVEAKGQRLVLVQVDGNHFAMQDLCTHDDGPLGEGDLFRDLIECPRHGARFNVKTGQAVTLPAVVPVKTYPVKTVGDAIFVEM